MNRVHRIVFNHALNIFQVASECAKAHGRGKTSASRRPPLLAGTVLALASTLANPAMAQGGKGGGSNGGAGGGVDNTYRGLPGQDGSRSAAGGGGGGPGAAGGDGRFNTIFAPKGGDGGSGGSTPGAPGADGESITTTFTGAGGGGGGAHGYTGTTLTETSFTGGNGGAGGHADAGDGGGGGAGGYGAVVIGAGTDSVPVGINLTGGRGGAGGGSGTYDPGRGGTGGAGMAYVGSSLLISGKLTGGQGGAGGESISFAGIPGGEGGAGLIIRADSVSVAGEITGGSGGAGGLGNGPDGPGGLGGVGILADDDSLVIRHAGIVSGGLSADGDTRADAIRFAGGKNRLELIASGTLIGNVDASSGSDDTLVLSGDNDGHFDTSAIGATGQYRGFEAFEKTGASTWTLTGTSSYTGGTTVTGGELQVASTGALGNGPVIVDGDGNTKLTFQGPDVNAADLEIMVEQGQLNFSNGASAEHAHITNNGALGNVFFTENSDAGTATLENHGSLYFSSDSSASNSSIVNTGNLQFSGNSNAGQTHINNTGFIDLRDESTAHNAAITNNTSARIDISEHSDNLSIGSVSGEGSIQLGSNTLTLGNLGQNDSIGGIIQDGGLAGGTGGSLTKTGPGTLTLTGVNTYTGDTTVASGTLLVNGTSSSSTHLVHSGAILGGTGTVGSTTIDNGGVLAPGGDAIGTLTVDGTLTLTSGSILNYQLGTPGTSGTPTSGRSDRIDISGDLALQGTLNLVQSSDAGDGVAGLGYYRLMTYDGVLSSSNLTLGDTPDLDAGYHLETGSNRVDLFIGTVGDNVLQHWQGGDGTWNATATQWLNQGGEVPSVWAGHHAIFKHQPGNFTGGVVTIQEAQPFQGLQFVDENYRLQGSGALETAAEGAEIRVLANRADIATRITGTGGLTKTGAGTLVLSGNNTYSGDTTLADGTLSVSADANLGHEDGTLLFEGGTLQVTGTDYPQTERNIVWGTHGGSFDITDEAHHFHVTQTIAGQGDLIKQGDGALTLAGDNAYGNTRVEGGWLLGSANSISGNITNAGVVAFVQDQDGSFSGDITGLGDIDGSLIKDGTGSLTLQGHSRLDWSITSGTLVTDASRFTGDAHLDSTTSGLSFNDAQYGMYGGTLSGTGQFTLAGTGTVLLTGDSTGFTGNTTVRAGTLQVGDADGKGSLGGSLDVLNGATLAGSGTVGSGMGSHVTIASGGTLAPGNSIGTLTVNGNLVFERGARFEVEANPQGSGSDRVEVTGDATLHGGTVAHIGAHGNYDPRSQYTVLAVDGDLTGAFDEVISDFAFLTPKLLYDYGGGTIDLELSRNQRDFTSVALTQNQVATAGGIDSIGLAAGHAVYDAIVQLPDNHNLIRRSVDALSGEIHASLKTALLEDSRFIRHAATDRLRAAFATPGASGVPVAAYDTHRTPLTVAASHHGPIAWTQAFGSWGKTNSTGNAASLDRTTGGMVIGADRPVGNWRIGVLAGYSHTSVKVNTRASSGKSDNIHLGLYSGTQWHALGLRMGAAHTWHDMNTRRSVAMPGLSGNPHADYHARTLQAFAELGYGIEAGAFRLEPYVNIAHVRLHTGGYHESGGATGLSGNRKHTDATFTTLGLHTERTFDLGTTAATLRGTLGWRRAFGNTTPHARHGFSAGHAFTVTGVPIAKNSALIEAGLDLSLTANATFGLSYAGQLAGSAQDHGVKADLTIRF